MENTPHLMTEDEWMAEIYCFLQWNYSISSIEINEKVPARELYRLSTQLKSLPIEEVCQTLYNDYWQKEKQPDFPLEIDITQNEIER